MSQQVLNRLREYVARTPDDESVVRKFPPVTPQLMAEYELELGFPLNSFLREVYLNVANGGFGPSYGLIGLPGGATYDDGASIIEIDHRLSESFQELWPDRLVPMCHYGCGMLGCVNCSHPNGAVTTWHPGLPPDDVSEWWKHNFALENESIVDWFAEWLKSVDAGVSPT